MLKRQRHKTVFALKIIQMMIIRVDAYTMAGIIKDAGMTVEEFEEVL